MDGNYVPENVFTSDGYISDSGEEQADDDLLSPVVDRKLTVDDKIKFWQHIRADIETVRRRHFKTISNFSEESSSESIITDATIMQKSDTVLFSVHSNKLKEITPKYSNSLCDVSCSDLPTFCHSSYIFSDLSTHKKCPIDGFVPLSFKYLNDNSSYINREQSVAPVSNVGCQVPDEYILPQTYAIKATQVNFDHHENMCTEYYQRASKYTSKDVGSNRSTMYPGNIATGVSLHQQDELLGITHNFTQEDSFGHATPVLKQNIPQCCPVLQRQQNSCNPSRNYSRPWKLNTNTPTSTSNQPNCFEIKQSVEPNMPVERQILNPLKNEHLQFIPNIKQTVNRYIQTEQNISVRNYPKTEQIVSQIAMTAQYHGDQQCHEKHQYSSEQVVKDQNIFKQHVINTDNCAKNCKATTQEDDIHNSSTSEQRPGHYIMMQYPFPQRKSGKSKLDISNYEEPIPEQGNITKKPSSYMHIPRKDSIFNAYATTAGQQSFNYTTPSKQKPRKAEVITNRNMRALSQVQIRGVGWDNDKTASNGQQKCSARVQNSTHRRKCISDCSSVKQISVKNNEPRICTKESVEYTSNIPLWKSIVQIFKSAFSTGSGSARDSIADVCSGESHVDAPEFVHFLEGEQKRANYEADLRRSLSDVPAKSGPKLRRRKAVDSRSRYGIVGTSKGKKLKQHEITTLCPAYESDDRSFRTYRRGIQDSKQSLQPFYSKSAVEADVEYTHNSSKIFIFKHDEKMCTKNNVSQKDFKSFCKNISNDNIMIGQRACNNTKPLSRSISCTPFSRKCSENLIIDLTDRFSCENQSSACSQGIGNRVASKQLPSKQATNSAVVRMQELSSVCRQR